MASAPRTTTKRMSRAAAQPAHPELIEGLPDYLRRGLDIVFVGINPGLASAAKGRHYAGPGNHFWPLLHEAGFLPEPLTHEEDWRCPKFGVGLTNLVDRPSRGIDDLSRDEMRAGAGRLREKLRRCRPRVVCFNGKLIYEVFAGHRCDLGLQAERLPEGALVYVMPSTSARTASYQRSDKLRFFRELKRIVDREASQ
ncbi:MAG: mismatch-specific DNA-glycosylase [Dehalococcoidia bacterium]